MDIIKVRKLLQRWDTLLEVGEYTSKIKASKSAGGLCGRIRRTKGQPVIFDFETFSDQKEIQDSLCKELPQLGDLIRSKPEIMDGYHWTRGDFIDLYYGHFRLVVDKIQGIINESTPL